MKILLDIGHPAHVHYFKHFIKIMKERGHQFCIVSRNKEFAHKLLDSIQEKYISRGRGSKGFIGKFLYILKGDFIIWKAAQKFKPDIFMSFASPYAAHVAKLFNKPHIVFDDTEHAKFGHMMYAPFSECILTPCCFTKSFKKGQVRFKSYMELTHLHPNYFTPNKSLVASLFDKENKKTVIFRFVSWEASHDIGKAGLSYQHKIALINEVKQYANIWISSENELPHELEKYRYPLPPETIHHALAFCDLFVGESATMASECAVLGTPAVYINILELGYINEQDEKYNLVYNFREPTGLIEKTIEILNNTDKNKNYYQLQQKKLLEDNIDLTDFMINFIENYPQSKHKYFQEVNKC